MKTTKTKLWVAAAATGLVVLGAGAAHAFTPSWLWLAQMMSGQWY